MNRKLGSTAIEEIRTAMTGLVGTAAKAKAVSLASVHECSWQHIYTMTKDLRTQRKPRSDKGKREFDLVPGTDVWTAAQLVVVDKLDPDQALLTARTRGLKNLPTLETFRRLLFENGLGKTQRRKSRRAHRRWEAEFPGQIFQIDCTALKTRWEDVTTRRVLKIEGIDKNHPQQDATKQRVWQIMLVDDHSRRRFLRYVVTNAVTSLDMVRFECEAFTTLGVPHILYTDNGSEFKGYHIRAERILGSLLANEGGYRHERHAPHNPQATGKVEGAHKWAEKADKYIGLAVSEGQRITIEDLNRFADEVCAHYDNRLHRATGEKPINRWHGKRVIVRKVAPDVIESALLSDEFPAVIEPGMTVTYRKVAYKLPNARPFVDLIGQTVQVVVPHAINMILMTLANGDVYEIDKVVAGVDTAGEYRTVAESKAARITRELKDDRKLAVKAIKEQRSLTGQIAPVPHLNVPIDVDKAGIVNFPHKEFVVSPEAVNDIIPVPMPDSEISDVKFQIPASGQQQNVAYVGKPITYWEAVAEYQTKFASKDDCKQFLLALFPNQEGELPVTQVEAAIDGRGHAQEGIRLAG